MSDEDPARRLCRHVRPDQRRPRAACRHRPHHRGGEGFHHLWRGGEVRRRQGDPRRHGAIAGHQPAGRGRHRDHQRGHPRSLGHREGRRRDQGRQDPFDRQGRQSGHPAERDHRHRPRHRRDRGRGKDPHGGRLRQPHPFHLPAADRRCADVRRHHAARRRHRAVARHLRHHLHAGAVAHRAHDPVVRCVPGQSRHRLQGQCVAPRSARGDDQGRRLRDEAARGLGHDAGRDRQLPERRRRPRRAGDDPHRHAQRVAASSRTRSRRSRAAPFTRSTPRARAAAMRRTSSRSRA